MNTQINLRLSSDIIKKAKEESKKRGFSNIQEFIKETLRKTLYDSQGVTPEELGFLKKLYRVSEDKDLYGTEKDLMEKLNKK